MLNTEKDRLSSVKFYIRYFITRFICFRLYRISGKKIGHRLFSKKRFTRNETY